MIIGRKKKPKFNRNKSNKAKHKKKPQLKLIIVMMQRKRKWYLQISNRSSKLNQRNHRRRKKFISIQSIMMIRLKHQSRITRQAR